MIPPFRREFDFARDPKTAFNALGYAEGTWTPTLTFATPGDLAVSYAATARVGTYTKVGRLITIQYHVLTSSFTHTTASGNLQITGLPFKSANTSNQHFSGALDFSGVNKAGYTQITSRINANVTLIDFIASAMGSAAALVTAADVPSAGTVRLRGSLFYIM